MKVKEFTIAPQRSVRVENELWEPSMARASREDDTLSQVIRRFLAEYKNGNDIITKAELLRQKAEAWDNGHSAGCDERFAHLDLDGALGGSEPRNPYTPTDTIIEEEAS